MNYINMNMNQKGQVVVALLLTILVGLSIGLVVTQRTITDVTTSSQTEQSSRAFSAAEAGIERAISSGVAIPITSTDTGNDSTADVQVIANLPQAGQALEYLNPIGKNTIAQFWLANPDNLAYVYPRNARLFLYFGNPNTTDNPAIETSLIYDTNGSGNYAIKKDFFDTVDRRLENGITNICGGANPRFVLNPNLNQLTTTSSKTNQDYRNFRCRAEITIPSGGSVVPIMLRVRLLYSENPQRIALAPDTAFGPTAILPPQASFYYSTGKSGQSQKTITLFQQKKVLNSFLDFAIYSNNPINK